MRPFYFLARLPHKIHLRLPGALKNANGDMFYLSPSAKNRKSQISDDVRFLFWYSSQTPLLPRIENLKFRIRFPQGYPFCSILVKYIFIYILFSSLSKPSYLAAKTRVDITNLYTNSSQIYTQKLTNLYCYQQAFGSQNHTRINLWFL